MNDLEIGAILLIVTIALSAFYCSALIKQKEKIICKEVNDERFV